MQRPALGYIHRDDQITALAGLQLSEVLSTELFREQLGFPHGLPPRELVVSCQDSWTDLADTIAALPSPAELMLFVGAGLSKDLFRDGAAIAFFALGRGETCEQAAEECLASFRELQTLLITNLDFARFSVIQSDELLDAAIRAFNADRITELRRRRQELVVGDQGLQPRSIGFGAEAPAPGGPGARAPQTTAGADASSLDHIFPWLPSDDGWRRLLETLRSEQQEVSLLVRARGHSSTPERSRREAFGMLSRAEKLVALTNTPDTAGRGLLARQIQILRDAAVQRLAVTEGRALAMRVFISSDQQPKGATMATLLASIDDASIHPALVKSDPILFGGAETLPASIDEVLSPLDTPALVELFGPREAPSVLRTPMPQDLDLPGVAIARARTAAFVGKSGDDIPLGICAHRGSSQTAALGESERFRHTYIVGQTGTGKSTLLSHMILSDIERGRGVAVLDPHGSLIEDVLQHIPKHRVDDVVVVDVTEETRPIPFNVLSITERDPERYRFARDVIIDDIYSFLHQTYDLQKTGGPIFETHFRSMLAMLLGVEPRQAPMVPNLAVFRSLYTNERLRKRLAKEVKGKDIILDEFLQEAEAAGYEQSIANIAPYITSKFSRFVSDVRLRRITCQPLCLDIDQIIAEGKILLFHLGRGRFGDQAAGLLASQLVSRIRLAVMRRGAHSGGKPFYLYADEFQLFADDRFSELMAEARKFGLSLTLAHQFGEQLPPSVLQAVLGNVGTVIALRVGARDAERLEPTFHPTFSRRDLNSQANFRACVRSFGVLGAMPFSVDLIPPRTGGQPDLAVAIRELSRLQHGRAAHTVDAEIKEAHQAFSRGL